MGSKLLERGPFSVRWHKAKKKKYSPTVVFVHHMWGSYRTPARHYRYLNEKGFDCVSFNLILGSLPLNRSHFQPLPPVHKGVFYIWMEQICQVLDQVPGEKIIFAFSGPSLSAFWASVGRSDILKFVCDGGPFDFIYENTKNVLRYEMRIQNTYLNPILSQALSLMWGLKPVENLHKALQHWPKDLPILSIRGLRDPIVPPHTIRAIFEKHPDLNLNVLELQHGQHLDGLRDFPNEYKKNLYPFLTDGLEEVF